MYFLFGIFVIICIIFLCLNIYRKKCIIRKICQMDFCQKVCLLNDILAPFGFCYQEREDIVVTATDAWQRKFGYQTLYDRTAHSFQMVFDCEPVYFYYEGRTYRIELWKGQYGINIGGEVGIYYAEGILPPEKFDGVRFQSVSDEDMLMIDMTLCHRGQELFEFSHKHWWLAGFCTGKYCEPGDLAMKVSITFQNYDMMRCFVDSLVNMGYQKCDIAVCNLTVTVVFGCPHAHQPRCCCSWMARFSQWKNRIFCRIYLFFTRRFSCTLDRILYLYFFLPSFFRKMFRGKRNRRQKCRRKRKAVRLREL